MRRLYQHIRPLLHRAPGRLLEETRARRSGTVRQQEALGLLPRPNYAYGLLRAADLARWVGKKKVTVCEFGVAAGNGLVAMCDLAGKIGAETGVEFRIVGFDTGAGLPTVGGYEDHPEVWSPGDFPMVDRDALTKRIGGRAELIFGDINTTIDGFTKTLDADAPLGFVSIDVDIYSGSKAAMRCLLADPSVYVPAVSMYFDDVTFFFANRWCGELRAIDEFNRENELRKIDTDRSIFRRTVNSPASWHACMYACHILDHELRRAPQKREGLTIERHAEFMRQFNLF